MAKEKQVQIYVSKSTKRKLEMLAIRTDRKRGELADKAIDLLVESLKGVK